MKSIIQTIMLVLVFLPLSAENMVAGNYMEYEIFSPNQEIMDIQSYADAFWEVGMNQEISFPGNSEILRAPGTGGPIDTGDDTGDKDQDDFVNDGHVGDGLLILCLLSALFARSIYKRGKFEKQETQTNLNK